MELILKGAIAYGQNITPTRTMNPSSPSLYTISQLGEEKLLLDAMNAGNPSLSRQEVLEQLARRSQQ